MYAIFGDWDLVLASYNSGPGNVAKAIRRSGGKQNYWNIRKYLPKETQGYLPAFLATMYIFEYHKEHGIKPERAVANHFATDTILIKNTMTFKQISDLLDVPVAELQFLNPSYKREVVPFVTGEEHYLRLPIDKIALFTSNEEKVYAYVKYEENLREKPYQLQTLLASNDSTATTVSRVKYHKVRRGDSLSEISDRYGITMAQLKKWNHLRSNKAPLGKNLKIYTKESIAIEETESVAVKEKKQTKQDTTSVSVKSQQVLASADKNEKIFKEEKVISYKDVTKFYKVRKGDNLSEVADKNGVTVAEIKKWNKLKGNNINAGANLKIVKNERIVTTVRKEIKQNKPIVEKQSEELADVQNNNVNENSSDYYIVQKGDNLLTIAKKFNVKVEDLKEWNKLDDSNIKLGSKLSLIHQDEEENNNDVAEQTSPVTETKTVEYVVKNGDNLGNIAKKYNVSISDLKDWNNLEDNTVKIGDKMIVSKKLILVSNSKPNKKEELAVNERNNVKHYLVKKGDSLFSIAKKYPGVSISDIKKWNGIKNESLKPGMKLKING
jgi:membrane-bound lytic murein transglycosylase D